MPAYSGLLSKGFSFTGHDILGCVVDVAGMHLENSPAAVAIVVAHFGVGGGAFEGESPLKIFRGRVEKEGTSPTFSQVLDCQGGLRVCVCEYYRIYVGFGVQLSNP